MKLLDGLLTRLEQLEVLDRVITPVSGVVGRAVQPRTVRNLLSGSAMGHPLHPLLTDVPIGAWSMAVLLDTVDDGRVAPAADLLVATGIAAAVPTAASGLNDWSDTRGPDARVGLAHAVMNSAALSLYTASLIARRSGRRGAGKTLAAVGFAALMAGGFLGGHLSYASGVRVNRTAWRPGPTDWTDVLAEADLAAGRSRRVEVEDVSLLLHRSGSRIEALDSVCSHMGGPLEDGEIRDGCVTCPWHGSTFRLEDGSIVRGPASTPQPSYETRIREGHIQVRRRS